jgi:hypothetical protein
MTTVPISVDSAFRGNSGTDSDFTYPFPQGVTAPTGRVRLKCVSFINTIQNVSSSTNSLDVIEYDNEGANPRNVNVTIPAGNYNFSSLASALKTALEDESFDSGYSLTYTLTLPDIDKHLVIAVSGGNQVSVGIGGTLNLRLGLSRVTPSPKGTSTRAPRIINLAPPPFVYILSSIGVISAINNSIDYSPNVLSYVKVDQQFGNYVYYEPIVPYVHAVGRSVLASASFRLVDENFVPVDLDGGRVVYQLELL